MNDNITESLPVKHTQSKMTRRRFLQLLGVSATAAGGYVLLGLDLDKIDALEEKFSQYSLLANVNAGKFASDRLPSSNTIETLKNEIINKTETLGGVSAAGIYISDIDQNVKAVVGNHSEKFIPGSLIKIPLLYRVWLSSKLDGVDYLTPEIAEKILHKSESSQEFIMGLPANRYRDSGEFDTVVMEMLNDLHIPSEQLSDGNLQIELLDYFNFLRKTELPEIIRNAILQTEKDDDKNYGISKILQTNSNGNDAFFKIGLAQSGNETINSYVIMFGENIKSVGYAKGSNVENVHEQMLITAALLAKYASK